MAVKLQSRYCWQFKAYDPKALLKKKKKKKMKYTVFSWTHFLQRRLEYSEKQNPRWEKMFAISDIAVETSSTFQCNRNG